MSVPHQNNLVKVIVYWVFSTLGLYYNFLVN